VTRCVAARRTGARRTGARRTGARRTGAFACRVGCAACCIAPSISSPIPGMPDGKPAGVRCVQLTPDNRCRLFGHPDRPEVCVRLRPNPEMCGADASAAMAYLSALELATEPNRQP
jgi:hypothetical protein